MNKIVLTDNNIVKKLDKKITLAYTLKEDDYDVNKIKIEVLEDTDLNIIYENVNKVDLEIIVHENVLFNLYEYRESDSFKIQNKFYLEENSNVMINKFINTGKLKELDLVYLNGSGACINHNLNTIGRDTQRIDLIVYHNSPNTTSNLVNKAVSIEDGSVTFNVTGTVYNNIVDCIVNQDNRIINLNDNKCTINPILLIDENDVEANHAASIGKFKEKDIFYLMSRGIPYKDALNLLIKGFLFLDVKCDDKINDIIDKCWR